MKRKIFSILFVLVLVVSFSLVMAVPAAAQSTWYVATTGNDTTGDGSSGNPWATIGYAISQASASDTIIAADGTYTEDLTVNIANLTIRSASGAASTTIQLVDGVGIDIQGGASNFTLGGASGQGFTILSGSTTTFNIQLANAPSSVEISYNTIDTTGNASMGVSVGAAGASGLIISNNSFTAEDGDGSIWGPTVASANVSNNTFTGPTTPTSGYAIQFSGVTGTSTINANTITNMATGIFVYSADTTVSGLTISGNTISGSIKGIRLGHSSQDNAMTTVTVTQNTLSTNTVSIYISADADSVPSQFTINNNNISGSTTFGLQNDHSTSVTAENNWWGDASGPTHSSNTLGTGDTVSDSVDFIPWLGAAYPGGQPVGLVTNTTQNTGHATIQAAINAASAGDTIVARDGTYTEDLTVNTANLTLRSLNGKAVTTIQLVTGVGIDIQGGADGFTLGGAAGQGFTVLSSDVGSTTFNIQLTNAPSDVRISYNTIDTRGNASMGVSVGAAGASGLTISNNTFYAEDGDGSIWGPNVADVTVSNNTISGGAYGVQFSGVTGTSAISNNNISSCTGSGAIVISNGAGTSGLTITGNTILSCSNGIYFVEYCAQGTAANMTTVTVTYNYISGSTNDAIKIGDGVHVLASNFTIMYNAFINSGGNGLNNAHTSEQVTAEWNWWDFVGGPDDAGNKNPYDTQANAAGAETCTANVDFTPWMIHTSLSSGWNIYSTPIASDTSTDTIAEALDFWGSDASLCIAAYYFDASINDWVQPILGINDSLTPLVPVYLNLSSAAAIDVLMSTSNNAPPAMTMYQGWNLVGPAELYNRLVDVSLTDAYYGTGVAADLWGYSKAISPSIHQTAQWTFLRGAAATGSASTEYFVPTEGYWVYMVNQGALGGFTYTPITPLP